METFYIVMSVLLLPGGFIALTLGILYLMQEKWKQDEQKQSQSKEIESKEIETEQN